MSQRGFIRLSRLFGAVLGLFLLASVSFGVLLYVRSTWYSFEEPHPFEGDTWYNPYQRIDDFSGLRANFHAHSECWSGLTNGKGSEEEVQTMYKRLGYDVYSLSNYHKIDTRSDFRSYEHGWGIGKTHQLVVGANEVSWVDFPFFQNIHQKQSIIDFIREENGDALVILAHPSLRGAYNADDIARLDGFDAIEAVNKLRKSLVLWDEVLSKGAYIPAVAGDDCHNIYKPRDYGRCLTVLLSRNNSPQAMKAAIKMGRTLAVEVGGNVEGDVAEKSAAIKQSIPLEEIKVEGNLFMLKLERKEKEVFLIGDHSDTLFHAAGQDIIYYEIPSTSTYVRAEIVCENGARIYTNPIVRCKNAFPLDHSYAQVWPLKTYFYRFIILFIVSFIWLLILIRIYDRIFTSNGRTKRSGVLPRPGVSDGTRSGGVSARLR
jgi:hypothetical protein